MKIRYASVTVSLTALIGSLVTQPAAAQYTPPTRLALKAAPLLRTLPAATPFAEAVAVADLRRSQRADLITTSTSQRVINVPVTNLLSVHLSDGEGGYAAPISYPLPGKGSRAIVVADFNRDNIPDVLVGNGTQVSFGDPLGAVSVGIQVFLGRGDGTLRAPINTASIQEAYHVATGDFNGDGKLDIATTGFPPNIGVFVAFGRGDGSFLPPTNYDRDYSYLNDIKAADVDGNGRLDLIVARQNGDVTVLPGQANGRFGSPRRLVISPTAIVSKVFVGDFNSDNKPDIIAASSFEGTFLLYGRERGAFRNPVKVSSAPVTGVADLNRDGKLDFVGTTGATEILLNTGSETFRVADRFFGQGDGSVIADVDYDGKLDLVRAGIGISVVAGNGNGTFQAATTVFSGLSARSAPYAVTIGDFNSDGQEDFAVANAQESTVSIFLNRGETGFQKIQDFGTGTLPIDLTTADFNGDGKLDLAVVNAFGGSVNVFQGQGNGTFGSPVTLAVGNFPVSIKSGDINRDGKPDLAVANANSNTVSILLNQGSGQFASSTVSVGGFPSGVVLDDFNVDGKLDLAVVNQSDRTVSVAQGRGDGSFESATTIAVGAALSSLTSGDVDGNGKPDIVVTEIDNAAVTVLLNNGMGFVRGQTYRVAPAPDKAFLVRLSDLDEDGILDIVTANDIEISVLIGSGNGEFETARQFFGGSGPIGLAIGDLNGDKRPDIVVANRFQSDVSLIFNTTPAK